MTPEQRVASLPSWLDCPAQDPQEVCAHCVTEAIHAAEAEAREVGRRAGLYEAARVADDCTAAAPSAAWDGCRSAIAEELRRLAGEGAGRG